MTNGQLSVKAELRKKMALKKETVLLLILLSSLIMSPLGLIGPAYAGTITLNPKPLEATTCEVNGGVMVSVKLDGFTAGQAVTITFGTATVVTSPVGQDGSLSTSFQVTNAIAGAVGTYTITITIGGNSYTYHFEVKPQPTPTPSSSPTMFPLPDSPIGALAAIIAFAAAIVAFTAASLVITKRRTINKSHTPQIS
jgi:hypothetical protein